VLFLHFFLFNKSGGLSLALIFGFPVWFGLYFWGGEPAAFYCHCFADIPKARLILFDGFFLGGHFFWGRVKEQEKIWRNQQETPLETGILFELYWLNTFVCTTRFILPPTPNHVSCFFFLHKLEEARNLSRCTCYVRTKRPGDGDGDGGEKKTKKKLMAGGGGYTNHHQTKQ